MSRNNFGHCRLPVRLIFRAIMCRHKNCEKTDRVSCRTSDRADQIQITNSRIEHLLENHKRLQFFFRLLSRNQEDASLNTRPEHHNSRKQENMKPENRTTFATTSDSEKEEGHYEELVCLVRQFYVERPVNPAAIAYQNIETC